MFNGTLKNTFVGSRPLARLSLGITGTDGKRAAMEFVRDEDSGDLVAQIDEAEPNMPTPNEIKKQRQSELNALAQSGGEICQDDYEWATLTGPYADDMGISRSDSFVCARCGEPISPDADYEFTLFPPIAESDSGERIYRYHPQCYTDDGAEHAEHRAVAFDPGYIPGGE